MPAYRIRYALYQIDAASAAEAKKQVCDMFRRNSEALVTVEERGPYNQHRPVWKRLLTGR